MENKIKELEEKLFLKELECEGLKNSRDEWMSRCEQEVKLREFINDQLEQFKAENKELKEQLKKEIEASQKWYQLHTEEHFTKLKAEQVLSEIKEIARWHTTSTDSEDIQDDMKQILQIISEVEL